MRRGERLFRSRFFVLGISAVPIVLTLLYMGFIAHRHLQQRGTVPVDSHPLPEAEVLIRHFHYSRTVDGKTKWFVEAERASLGKDETQTRIWDLKARIRVRKDLKLIVTGERGVIDQVRHRFYVEKVTRPVSARFSNGLTVISSHLKYVDRTDQIRTDGHVIILGPNMIIQGKGLKSVPRNQMFRIDRKVHAVFAD
ncbi:hypothetical protein LptCag_1349 [Leptospirillum ferriphilum]|uniref:LPS export ABC transporter periplasmic protein LptC n=2 Tax=Leptospirillum TaxID=179 RepID=A0A094X501_9BACT|nr:LPS export ABC transporter periplasmic protein LptC [Leptospirillum ferriphilum]EDZ38799.1 MAG: Protein of unknown function [Leptospirillum sp. Group II '5-way CG']KGA93639.1 hypothetical protein LptCag_1349 [Leptospirillum ferriphilum]